MDDKRMDELVKDYMDDMSIGMSEEGKGWEDSRSKEGVNIFGMLRVFSVEGDIEDSVRELLESFVEYMRYKEESEI